MCTSGCPRCGRATGAVDRDVRRRRRAGKQQRGHPGPGPAGLGVQAVRPGRRARGRHQPQEPLRTATARSSCRAPTRRSTTSSTSRLRRERRPGQGHRGLDQHRLRRPDPEMGSQKVVDAAVAAGIPEDTPGLDRRTRVVTLGHRLGAQHRHGQRLLHLRGAGPETQWSRSSEVKTSNGGTRYKAKVRRRSRRLRRGRHGRRRATRCSRSSSNGTGTEARRRSAGPPPARPAPRRRGRHDARRGSSGYTPQLRAAVDFYKGDGTGDLDGVGGLPTFFGGAYPARVWTAFMKGALEGKKVDGLPGRRHVGEDAQPEADHDADADPDDDLAEPDADAAPPTADADSPTDHDARPPTTLSRPDADAVAGDGDRGRDDQAAATAPAERRTQRGTIARMTGTATPVARRRGRPPSRDDPLVRLGSEVVGGPLGRHAACRRRRVVDAAAGAARPGRSLTCALGLSEAAVPGRRVDRARRTTRHACYTDIPPLYFGARARRRRGALHRPAAEQQVEYPVLTGAVDVGDGELVPADGSPTKRSRWYFDINVIALALCAAVAVVATALHRRPPAVGRGDGRARADARAGRHHQLGPVRRGAARAWAMLAWARRRPVAGRRADRARRRREVLPAASCSDRCSCSACGPGSCASSGTALAARGRGVAGRSTCRSCWPTSTAGRSSTRSAGSAAASFSSIWFVLEPAGPRRPGRAAQPVGRRACSRWPASASPCSP